MDVLPWPDPLTVSRNELLGVAALFRRIFGFDELPVSEHRTAPGWMLQALEWECYKDVLGPIDDPYMERWWIGAEDGRSVRIHHIMRSDAGVILPSGEQDRDVCHDHPWSFAALMVAGSYRDIDPAGTVRVVQAGEVVSHRAEDAHRLELLSSDVWSLVVTGPKVRKWGFHTQIGWRYWRTFQPDQLNTRSPEV